MKPDKDWRYEETPWSFLVDLVWEWLKAVGIFGACVAVLVLIFWR